MEKNAIVEADSEISLPPPDSTVAIAVKGNRKSKHVVQWALQKFKPDANAILKLFHVRPRITTVPTPMGNSLPISQVRDDVAAAYRKEIEWQTIQMLIPLKKMCAQRNVQADIIIIESDDAPSAIAELIAKNKILKLVIGASSSIIFRRKKHKMSARIALCAPSFCTVYAVSRAKLSSVRPSDVAANNSGRDDVSETTFSSESFSSNGSITHADSGSVTSYSVFSSASIPVQRFQALSNLNLPCLDARFRSLDISHSRSYSVDADKWKDDMSVCPSISEHEQSVGCSPSFRSSLTDNQSWKYDRASTSDVVTSYSSESQNNIGFELEKLRTELRHVRGMYARAQGETNDASRKLDNLTKRRLEEALKLKEISLKEGEAKESARQEKEKYEAARREAEYVRACIDREASQRLEAETKAVLDTREKEKLENVLVGATEQYQKFTWDEIVSATSSFSEDLKIGMGAYGSVYKCGLHHTTVAVKVLHSKDGDRNKQFQQELEILSSIHHPHLLLLIGACPDHDCLVYEYMENGSLEDCLLQKNTTLPIPWFDRYRIAWEVASALVFLHSAKPKPIIHRDLKPANILVDQNFVSKIGDVGLAKMLSEQSSSLSVMCKGTEPVGTICYIDPEYQRSGLVTPASDVYAFGMIILQLLTAKPAIGITHVVESALEDGRLMDVLDSGAGDWPLEETKELATVGLSCAELQRKDRPDLKGQVLPTLERLKEVAANARAGYITVQSAPPAHLICPILKAVMDDPCVAADGYTYDRKAIEKWLENNDQSPVTNLPLSHKVILPNYTLLSAILEWKSQKKR